MKNVWKVALVLAAFAALRAPGFTQVVEEDSLALVALYNSTDGPNWTNHDNWLSGPVSTWYGVTVDGDRVIRLDLTENNLNGLLPPEIGDLTELQSLALYNNHLTGTIPPEIGGLAQLTTLGLGYNQLEGAIPVEIGNLTELRGLYLDHNRLSGSIPAEIGNLGNLFRLSLAGNQLTGQIPGEMGNLTNLQALHLSHNQLSGEIPDELSRLTNLQDLDLRDNLYADTLKFNFANLTNLRNVILSANRLVGPLPVGLDSLPNLERLEVDRNRLVDLPDLALDTSLTILAVDSNRLTFEDIEPNVWVETFKYSPQDSVGEAKDTTVAAGEPLELSVSVGGTANQYQWTKDGEDIPGAVEATYRIPAAAWEDIGSYICRITNTIATALTLYSRPIHVDVAGAVSPLVQDSLALVALYNSTGGPNWTHRDNWLSGPVDTWYGVTVTDDRVTELSLSGNNLVGSLPADIGVLTGLEELYMRDDSLSGSIPAEIGNLSHLWKLNLTGNELTGSIPSEFGRLTSLEWMYLGDNQLSGAIPPELCQLRSLKGLMLDWNQLTGTIPSEIGGLTELLYLNLGKNQLEGEIPPEIGNLVHLRTLSLYSNSLTGSIPPEIGRLVELEYLYLSNNRLSGEIPAQLFDLTGLIDLQLGGNELTGGMPPAFERLTQLRRLGLAENNLSGEITVDFSKMKALEKLYLSRNEFVGALPASLDSLPELQRLYIHTNHFDDLPDLSQDTSLTRLLIANNRFTFEDIEPNVWVENFSYSPQDSVGEAKDTTVSVGQPLELSVVVGGTANRYQWSKDGVDIPGADSSVYVIAAASAADSGTYICRVTNTIATQLTLYSRPLHVSVSGGAGVEGEGADVPSEFALHQNYPNPFNPKTTIAFDVPRASRVRLTVFDLEGRELCTVLDEKLPAGRHKVSFDAGNLASGLYLYRLQADEFEQTRKMTLLR